MKASRAAPVRAGLSSGNVTLNRVRTGPAPRMAAASCIDASSRARPARTKR